MTVTLPTAIQEFVDEEMSSGQFASPQDVIIGALAALMQSRSFSQMPIEELEAIYPDLRAKVAEGIADLRS